MLLTVIFTVGCTPENNDADVKVTTYMPQDVTRTSAVCGGDVIVTNSPSIAANPKTATTATIGRVRSLRMSHATRIASSSIRAATTWTATVPTVYPFERCDLRVRTNLCSVSGTAGAK